MRIGIEIEYWLVDSDGALASAEPVAAACEGVEREFVDPLLEVKTPPCDSVEELVSVFAERLERVRDAARSRGRRLVPLGTPLSDERVSRRAGPRIDVQCAVLGDDLAHAAHCAGTHVHFEQVDVVDQLRALTALDPAFALVNTAPYYRSRRIAACARPYAYRRLCYRTLPEHGRLWRYPESAAEWRGRLRERFEAFLEAASDRNGVDRGTVESAFAPADAVWSPVRLRDDLGTVEWRAPDAAPPLSVCRLVADASRVVETAIERGTRIGPETGATDGALSLPPFDVLHERVDTAIERGVSAPSVERHLSELGIDPDAYRPPGVRIDGRDRIDHGTVRRLRRRFADRFDRDLGRLREDGRDAIEELPRPAPV